MDEIQANEVAPGTAVLLYGVHQSDRVPCADDACLEDPHWERPAGEADRYESNYTDATGAPVFRYHRTNERTAVAATLIEVVAAPKFAHAEWQPVGRLDHPLTEDESAMTVWAMDDIERARAAVIANAENVPMNRRPDGVWEKQVVLAYFDIPDAEPKARLILAGGTVVSADLSDVEVAS